MKLSKVFLDSIIMNLNTMPFGIRWLAKQLTKYEIHRNFTENYTGEQPPSFHRCQKETKVFSLEDSFSYATYHLLSSVLKFMV